MASVAAVATKTILEAAVKELRHKLLEEGGSVGCGSVVVLVDVIPQDTAPILDAVSLQHSSVHAPSHPTADGSENRGEPEQSSVLYTKIWTLS